MNMQSLILRTAGHFLLPLLLLFSLFLLFRGHNEPGGGFIAGLVAAAAVVLYLFSMDIAAARQVLPAQWWEVTVPGIGMVKLSSVLLFDIGVYLVVVGAVLTIMLSLAEAED
ncbi:MAG: Na(+)/H(+) antiporter subunit B [Thioalkalivibrio sp.]|nr:Na(+)/H(+) antiporter subunit B [Thioalkalivibrio sp.]